MPKSVSLKITNCKLCHHCGTTLTKGFGYATDFFCDIADHHNNADEMPGPALWWNKPLGRVIARYVEWSSQEPQDNDIPSWCPLLPKNKVKAKP